MSGNTIYPRLCSTCKHASTCTFPRDPQKPSFYCEEFEIETAPPRKTTGDDMSRLNESYAVKVEESVQLFGLCIDCENRQMCAFLRPEGGVWHCEEYQ